VIDALAYAGRVRVAKLNVNENPGVAARYAVPTLLLFDGGHLRDRLVGTQPRAVLEARLEEMLARTPRSSEASVTAQGSAGSTMTGAWHRPQRARRWPASGGGRFIAPQAPQWTWR
jgi:thioredoxin-like negative regulator of GroEL